MQLHQLKPIHQRKRRKRVGRGGKRGTYSGRGLKGQKARAGYKLQPVMRELFKKYPKLRGYRFKSRAEKMAVVNLEILERKFLPGENLNPQALLEKKIIRRIKGKVPGVKILARGELSKPLVIERCEISKGAKRKIEKAGGSIIQN